MSLKFFIETNSIALIAFHPVRRIRSLGAICFCMGALDRTIFRNVCLRFCFLCYYCEYGVSPGRFRGLFENRKLGGYSLVSWQKSNVFREFYRKKILQILWLKRKQIQNSNIKPSFEYF